MRAPSIFSRLVVLLYAVVATATAEWKPADLPGPAPTAPRWWRCYVQVPDNMAVPAAKDLYRDSVMLHLGGIHGPVTVLLNGQKIVEAATLPDTGRRRFKVPKGILQKGAFNSLVFAAAGPVELAPIISGYFDEVELNGRWEFSSSVPAPVEMQALAGAPPVAAWNQKSFHNSATPLAPTELMPGAKLPAKESLAKMTPGEGLQLDLVLSEPEIAQPTHLSFDEKGRLWVAQYRQYPFPAGLRMISRDKFYGGRYDKLPPAPPHQDKGHDVISVEEDTDGDGIYDKHKVVLEGLNMANAALHGHGGIWVMNTPYLLFYPDRDGHDVPDSDPEVRLAGFGLEDTHSVANGLVWGPDGWLYGAQGSTTTSRVVRPGIDPAAAPGVYFEGCMVWRYHPKRKIYEIFAEGGGNNFGLDFDGEGRLYTGLNSGGSRGWCLVPDGLFLKQGIDPGKFGPGGNPFAFGNLGPMKSDPPVQRFSHMIIVAEGSALPPALQGRIIGADPLHHQVTISERYVKGSTFTTRDSGLLLKSDDESFRPVFVVNGPDGALYVADFYEEFIAHGQNYQGQIDPTTGRIYRLRGTGMPLDRDINLAAKTTPELVSLLSHPNRWHRQTAVRLLAERGDRSVLPALRKLLAQRETHPALEALWSTYQLGALDEGLGLELLTHAAAPVRAWALRLLGEAGPLTPRALDQVSALLLKEPDAEVRSQAASTARRQPRENAIALVVALLARNADAEDANIPLLCWWALESHCDEAPAEMVKLAAFADTPMAFREILPRLMRRYASTGKQQDLLTCAELLRQAHTPEQHAALISGLAQALEGRAVPLLPEALQHELASDQDLPPLLKARLGDRAAIAAALAEVGDVHVKKLDRLLCIRLFGEVKTPEAAPALQRLMADAQAPAELRQAAIASLLAYDDPAIGPAISQLVPQLPEEVRTSALNLLASRESWSASLVALLRSGSVTVAQIPEEMRARLLSFPSFASATRDLLPANWQTAAAGDRHAQDQAELARIKTVLACGAGDPYQGEATFLARCAACHTLFFKGGQVGPNLTAYQRDDLGTLLPSIINPSAEIREGFENYLVTTTDGRALSGLLADQDNSGLTLRGLDGQNIRVPRAEIRESKRFDRSLMPDGLLTGLSDQELRDFFAYLRMPQPITR